MENKMLNREEMQKHSKSALAVYRILDLADEQGVYCGKLLADLGADVIKVESPSGDKLRGRGPFFHDEVHHEKSLHFLHYNTNKRSITLNLELEDGRALFKELVIRADAVLETFRPGYLESLGLGYGDLQGINPGMVMTSITPFGQTGPHRDLKATDLVNIAMSGLMHLTGPPEGPPLRMGGEQSYHFASQYAAVGTVGALYHRALSGRGQHVDVSIQECCHMFHPESAQVQAWALLKRIAERPGMRYKGAVPIGVWQCKDGWVMLYVPMPAEWERLSSWVAEVTGEEVVLDPLFKGIAFERAEYADVLEPIFLDFFPRFTKAELLAEGLRRRVPLHPLRNVEELVQCPQVVERNFLVEAEHPVVGRLRYPGGPYRMSETPWGLRRAAPLLGEANEEVYCGELGLAREQLAVLKATGAI